MKGEVTQTRPTVGSLVREYLFMGQSASQYLRSLVTPWNALAAVILGVGIPVAVIRFTQGLASTTNLSNDAPWGIWIGVDVLCGVALAAGGYTMAAAFYVMGLKEYKPLVRPAVLTGFLGYFFVVVGLLFDLGRPWRLPYPMLVSFGFTSVMFLVAWHVGLYLACQFIEFSPAILEWLNLRRLLKWAEKVAVGATIAGVTLSTLHQSALGGLFLMAPGKLHPLWYTPFLPLFFFISSIAAGISIVIVESTISHRAFHRKFSPEEGAHLNKLTVGLAKAGSAVLFGYFWLKIVGIASENTWSYLISGPGYWFAVEMLGFILLPSFLFLMAAQHRSVRLARLTALLTVVGVIVNRLNVSVIALNWQNHTYVPRWSEVVITITIVTLLVLTFRWIVNRMPVLQEHPDFKTES